MVKRLDCSCRETAKSGSHRRPSDQNKGARPYLEGHVKGRVHTNGMENFWSLLKRSLHGSYVAIEPFHLFRYVDEQAFRYNNRATKDNPLTDSDCFLFAMHNAIGKRLTYAELTGKTSTTPF